MLIEARVFRLKMINSIYNRFRQLNLEFLWFEGNAARFFKNKTRPDLQWQ
jgi:hypothetical protein